MRFHGNYCGPNWSAGQHQPSVVSDVPAVDHFDDSCRKHDAVYATSGDLLMADWDFATTNLGGGIKPTAAAIAVGVQAVVRAIDKQIPNVYKNPSEMTKNLRGTAPPGTKSRGVTAVKSSKNAPSTFQLSTVPAAYGYSLRMTQPKIVRNGNSAVITGSDFASSVFVTNSSNYEPAASVLINPMYFQNAMLGSMSRTYEKYRVKRAVLEYIPAVPTSTQGQIVMTSTSTVKEPFIPGSSTTFLSRALSQGNAVATPIWKEAHIEVPGSQEWSIVDTLIDADLDDSICHEVQVYATCDATLTAGILVLHYEIEFKEPLYTYHATLIPNPIGNGVLTTLADNTAVNANSVSINLSSSSVPLSQGFGSVYRMVFLQGRSVKPTGPGSWSAVAKIQATSALNTSTVSSSYTNISMDTGTVVYGVFNSGLVLYGSYDNAVAGSINGALVYQTATTAVGSWVFLIELVRLSNQERVTVQ